MVHIGKTKNSEVAPAIIDATKSCDVIKLTINYKVILSVSIYSIFNFYHTYIILHMELTETYGCVQKDTVINLPDRRVTIEDIWNEYYADITTDDEYPNVEFSEPKSDLNVLVFDGTNFVNHKVKKIIRFNVFSCINDVYLDNGFSIHGFDECKLLKDDGLTNKIRRGMKVGIPKEFDNNTQDYCADIDGNVMFVRVAKVDFRTVKDYVYSLEIDGHDNFVGNGIVCGDFYENNK